MVIPRLKSKWVHFWMRYSGINIFGRTATRLAVLFAPPLYARSYLARANPKGYFSPSASFYHKDISFGRNVFIGDHVVFFQAPGGKSIVLNDRAHIYGDTSIQTGSGGSIKIGENSHIHPHCQLSAYKSAIIIGREVQIAPNCAFYPYNHGIAPGTPIQDQPLTSKGDIVIDDDAWLGYSVIVLDGVHIGEGAVVGAGSIVTGNIPSRAVVTGAPARVVKMRDDIK